MIIRLFFLHELLASFPFFETTTKGFDQHTYNVWAQEIANGDWLGRTRGVFYFAPLYPYLLSVAYLAGGVGNIKAGLCLNLLFGVTGAAAAAGLGLRVFGPLAGLAAGLIMALNGGQLPYEGILLNDSVLPDIALVGLWAFMSLAGRQRESKFYGWAAAGVLFGLMITGRPSNLLPAAALAAWLFVKCMGGAGEGRNLAWRRMVPFISFVIGMSIVPGLCVARNLHLGGKFTMTRNGPINIYMGNAPGASGVFEYTPNVRKAMREIHELPDGEREAAWRARLRAEVLDDPLWMLRMLVLKTWLFSNSWDAPDNLNIYFLREQLTSMKFTLGPHALYVLGAVGIVLTYREWRRLVPLYLFALALAASLIAVLVVGRYKLPFLALLTVFAGAAAENLWTSLTRRNWTVWGVAAGVGAVGLVIFYPLTFNRAGYAGVHRANEYLVNGAALVQAGRTEEAKRMYERGVEHFPRFPGLAEELAAIEWKEGNWSGVLAATQPLLERRVITQSLAELHVLALLKLNRREEARRAARRLTRYAPASEMLRQSAALPASP